MLSVVEVDGLLSREERRAGNRDNAPKPQILLALSPIVRLRLGMDEHAE
jgi:hypothetical protein